MSVVDGLVSGLDTTSVIKQLLAVERAPISRFQAKEAAIDQKLQAWGDIQRAVSTLRTATSALARSSTFTQSAATTSSAENATAVARDGATPGSVTFKVHQLATVHSAMTSTSVGSTSQLTGAGRVAVGVGLQSLGVTGLNLGAGAVAGVLEISVRASSATQAEVRVGSATTIVDRASTSVSVGGLQLAIGPGGLVDGSGKVQVVDTTDTSTVGSLASTISVARAQVLGLGATATPDRRLVFTGLATGEANKILVARIDLNATMAAALGTLSVVSEAKDAKIELGTGLFVTRSTNALTDLVDGLTIQLVKADPTKDVTVDAAIDHVGLASKVKDWVSAMNSTLGLIDTKSAYDATAKTGGVLLGDSTAQRIRQSLTSPMSATVAGGTFRNLQQLGVTVDANGRYKLDEAKLGNAIKADASSVGQVFARSATATNTAVSFVGGSDSTVEGTYAVAVTRAATQATVTGAAFTVLGADEKVDFALGSTSVSVNLTSGQALADVVTAINSAFASKGFAGVAELTGGAVRVRSNTYGSATSLAVTSSRAGTGSTGLGGAVAATANNAVGVDVDGTIDGVAALGAGQVLTASSGHASGLRLRVDSTTIGALGSVTYLAGAGGGLMRNLASSSVVDSDLASATGSLSSLRRSYEDRVTDLERRISITETRLRRQFGQMETLLSQLRAQGSRLSASLGTGSTKNG